MTTPATTVDDAPEPIDQTLVLDMSSTRWLDGQLFAADIVRRDGTRQYVVLDLDNCRDDTTDPLARAAAPTAQLESEPRAEAGPRCRLAAVLRRLADALEHHGKENR